MLFLITGARGGIGLQYVRELSDDKSNTVVAVVRSLGGDITALQNIKDSNAGRVHVLECDISAGNSVTKLADDFSKIFGSARIDVLINNAAILGSRGENSLAVSSDSLSLHINTNVLGSASVVQALLPYLASQAIIANITSGSGSLAMLSEGRIKAENTSYCISKAALNMLTIHQAKHLQEKVVVCIDPGHVKTEMGGPGAVLEVADSAKGVLGVIAKLKPEDSGKFLLYNGTELPW